MAFSFHAKAETDSVTAVLFDGRESYVKISAPPVLGTNFTEEAWILPQSAGRKFQGILGFSPSDIARRAPGIWQLDGTKLHAGFGDGQAWIDINSPSDVLELNAWNHVAATYDGTRHRLFANGNEVMSSERGQVPFDQPVAHIGRVDNFFSGAIREVRLWKRALADDEIRSQMFTELRGDEEGLAAYFRFDEGSGGEAKNSAVDGSGSPATLLNGAQWITSTTPVSAAALAAIPKPPEWMETFAPQGNNVAPDAAIEITLRPSGGTVSRSSMQLRFDDLPVEFVLDKNSDGNFIVRHQSEKLWKPGTRHAVKFSFVSSGASGQTNTFSYRFSVSPFIMLSK